MTAQTLINRPANPKQTQSDDDIAQTKTYRRTEFHDLRLRRSCLQTHTIQQTLAE